MDVCKKISLGQKTRSDQEKIWVASAVHEYMLKKYAYVTVLNLPEIIPSFWS